MEFETTRYEDELIEALSEAFSIATEFLDAPTIIKCIKAALDTDKEYYSSMLEKYQTVDNSIIPL